MTTPTILSAAEFRKAPWRSLRSQEIKELAALTFPEERQVAVWLAKEYYKGQGEIIDAGAFFGGSALTLALGVRENASLQSADKAGRVHSYDNFTWASWIRKDLQPPDVQFGTSFLNKFHDTIRKAEDAIVVYPGDITHRVWRGGPIELLFVDCAKTFAANAAVIRIFFPHLIPGRAIVNQQDFAIQSRLVWIHAAMEYFWDKFEELGSTIRGGTTLFRLTRAISAEECEACVSALKGDCLTLAEKAARRFDAADRRHGNILASIEAYQKSPLDLAEVCLP